MTEWEQIKKEYREIPIPTDGPHQMLEVIADAKRKRNRWKHIAKYGSIVAAAMLVVLILPGIFLFSSGFGGSNDMAATESAVSSEESTGSNDWLFLKDTATAEDTTENKTMAPQLETAAPEYGYDVDTNNSGGSSKNDSVTEGDNGANSVVTPATGQSSLVQSMEDKAKVELESASLPTEAISREILRQMEERMQAEGETYYIKSEIYPDGFEMITEEQAYYINEEGLYVIVFEAGEVAPEEQGIVEFVIPAEVAAP